MQLRVLLIADSEAAQHNVHRTPNTYAHLDISFITLIYTRVYLWQNHLRPLRTYTHTRT